MNIEMHPVSSSNVAAVGYDEESKTLAVEFHNGGVYHYYDVPPNTFKALLTADSVGQYLNMVVKSQFSFSKVG